MVRHTTRSRVLSAVLVTALLWGASLATPALGEESTVPANRYGTAARAALEAFPEGATTAVVASGEDFPDALAAAPLADAFDAPILLTGSAHLPDVTAQTLDDLEVEEILLMGGEAAVNSDVSNALSAHGHVTRIAGG